MRRSERVLADDFGQRIRKARAAKGWSQEDLARKMAEKVNVIKSSESGRRPPDAVIQNSSACFLWPSWRSTRQKSIGNLVAAAAAASRLAITSTERDDP